MISMHEPTTPPGFKHIPDYPGFAAQIRAPSIEGIEFHDALQELFRQAGRPLRLIQVNLLKDDGHGTRWGILVQDQTVIH